MPTISIKTKTLAAGVSPLGASSITAVASANYGLFGNIPSYGLSGTITLPSTLGTLAEIDITSSVGGMTFPAITSGFTPSGTISFSCPTTIARATTSGSVTLTFTSRNAGGTPLSSPLVVVVTLDASAVTSVSGTFSSANNTVDPVTRQVHAHPQFVPVMNGNHVPTTVSYWLSQDNGVTYGFYGVVLMTSVGQAFSADTIAPTTAGSWKFACLAGWYSYSSSVPIPVASLPAGCVFSSTVSVSALTTPLATDVTSLTISAGAGGANPYNALRPDGSQYWNIPSISWSDSGCLSDGNAFVVVVTCTDLDSTHTAIGPEHIFGGFQVSLSGSTQTLGPLQGDYGTNGISYTRSGNIAYVRCKVYVENRVDQTNSAWSNSLASTVQTGIGSGAGYVDVLVATGGLEPSGKIPATRIDPNTLNNLSNMVLNPVFATGDLSGWSLPSGSVNIVAGTSGYTGDSYITLTPDPTSHGAQLIEKVFHACRPGDQFYAEAYVTSSTSAVGQCFLEIAYFSNVSAYLGSTSTYITGPYTGGWYKLSCNGTAPANTSYVAVEIVLQGATGTGELWAIDNILLTPQVSTSTGTTPDGNGGVKLGTTNTGNLVMNPGFEDGTPGTQICPHWNLTVGPNAIIQQTSGAYSGQNVLLFQRGPTNSAYAQSDWIGCKPTEQYYCEVYVLSDASTTDQLAFVIEFADGTQTYSGYAADYVAAQASAVVGVWTKFSYIATIPSGSSFLRWRFNAYPIGGPTSTTAAFAVDNALIRLQVSTGNNPAISPDGNGGTQFNSTNLANMVINPGFETGDLTGWFANAGTVSVGSGGAYTGNYYCRLVPDPSIHISQVYEATAHQCRAGDLLYAECYCQSSATANGQFVLVVYFLDNTGTLLSPPYVSYVQGPIASWTKISVNATAPANTSTARLYLYCQAETGTSASWVLDNVWLAAQPTTGNGTQPDGNGGVEAKLAALGGLAFDGSGNTTTNLGYTMTVNGSNQVVLSNLPTVAGLPALPSTTYPAGSVVCDTLSGTDPSTGLATPAYTLYRNPTGSAWVASHTPSDMVAGAVATGVTLAASQISAGSLIAGVVYAGNITASQVTSGTFSGLSMILNLNGVTTTIGNIYDSGAGNYVGLKTINNSSGAYAVTCSSSFYINNNAGSVGILYPGSLWLTGTGSTISVHTPYSFSLYDGSHAMTLTPTELLIAGLPSSSPGTGSKQFWYDPSDSNRVKFAP